MDQEQVVNLRIKEAHQFIERLAEGGQLVGTDAFWMEDLEDDTWTLHVVSPTIDEIGIRGGYDAIIDVLRAHPEIQIDLDSIRPHRISDAVAVEALNFIRNYPTTVAFRLRGVYLRGRFVQHACLYPVVQDGKWASDYLTEAATVR